MSVNPVPMTSKLEQIPKENNLLPLGLISSPQSGSPASTKQKDTLQRQRNNTYIASPL